MHENSDIADKDRCLSTLPFDIWVDAGLIKSWSCGSSAGQFLYTADSGAADLNYFLFTPGESPEDIPVTLERDIISFYETRNKIPAVTGLCDEMPELVGTFNREAVHEFDFSVMAGDLATLVNTIDARDKEQTLHFRRIDDMSDPDYLSIFKSVFLSDGETHYDKALYASFLDTYRNAVNIPSFSPWAVVGYEKDTPVSMTTMLPKGDKVGLYSWGVRPDVRQGGYGTQTLREAFYQADQGGFETVFLTTLPGSTVEAGFSRIGLQAIARYSYFSLK